MNSSFTSSSSSSSSRTNQMETLEDRRLFASTFQNIWPDGFGSDVVAGDVAVDKNTGAIFLAGRFRGSVDINPGPKIKTIQAKTSFDSFVARFTPNGKLKWVKTFDGGSTDGIVAIDVGPKGVAVAGQSINGFGSDTAYILRYTLKGARKLKAVSSGDFEGEVRGVGIDSKNNVYFSGYVDTEMTFKGVTVAAESDLDEAGFLFKVNKSNQLVWHKEQNEDASISDIAIDNEDNVYLAGSARPGTGETLDLQPNEVGGEIEVNDGTQNAFAAKLLPNGDLVWGNTLHAGGNNTGFDALGRGIAVDADGNVAITGQFSFRLEADDIVLDANSPGDAFVAKLDPNGEFLFAHGFGPDTGSGSNDLTLGRDVAFDSKGNLIVAGVFQGDVDFDPGADEVIKKGGSERGFLLKLNRNGNFVKFYQPTKGATSSDLFGVDVNEDDFIVTAGGSANDDGLAARLIQLKSNLRA